jgi:hypothetical protein
MSIYIYDKAHAEVLNAELKEVQKCRDLKPLRVSADTFLYAIRTVLHHRLVVLPGDVSLHSELVERVKGIAYLAGIEVRGCTAHLAKVQHPMLELQRNKKTEMRRNLAAVAASPTQLSAAGAANR